MPSPIVVCPSPKRSPAANVTFRPIRGDLSSVHRIRQKNRSSKPLPSKPNLFRTVARLALICVKLAKSSHRSQKTIYDVHLPVAQLPVEVRPTQKNEVTVFDPSLFKANHQRTVPQDIKRILQMPPQDRTEKDMLFLQMALIDIQAFSVYPKKKQSKMCEVAWYERYEPRRVIIRQGHVPHAYYILLSGSVVVTAYDGAERRLLTLHRGMSFGDLALINSGGRNATVSSQTNVELMCVSEEDFRTILVSGGVDPFGDSDQRMLFKNIGFLQKWPTQLLVENQEVCRLHYFNRGQVLVLDSTKSEWIYIVKSGSISVLQKVQNEKAEANDTSLNMVQQTKAIQSRASDSTRRFVDDPNGHWMCSHDTQTHRSRSRNLKKGVKSTPMKLNQQQQQGSGISRIYNQTRRPGPIEYENTDNDPHLNLEPPSSNKKQIRSIQNDLRRESLSPQNSKLLELMSQVPAEALPLSENEASILYEPSALKEEILENSKKGKPRIQEERGNSDRKAGSASESVFLLIQVLERGQNFGLSSLVFEDQPPLSVISNGAECIMLSKKFYLQHASEYNIEALKRTEYPYPSLQKMQKNLYGYMLWVSYRSGVYNEKVKLMETKKQKREQCLPQYTGQYSHRTGPR